jgi:hypothetical protein
MAQTVQIYRSNTNTPPPALLAGALSDACVNAIKELAARIEILEGK